MTQKNKIKWLTSCRNTALIAVLALLTYGCAAPSENSALMSARDAYTQAKADPSVATNAAVPLYEAQKTLTRAGNAESDGEMTHLAYMATQQTAIAVAMAEQKAAELERQRLAGDTNRILLRQKEQQTAAATAQAAAANAQKMALEQELAALKAKKTDRGYVLTLGNVLFKTGKADLMPGAQRTIDQLVDFLNKHPEERISVEGHTDNTGSDSFNMMLSQSRAEAVASAVMVRGISRERITTKGFGEMYPLAGNDTASGRQENRRVKIVFLAGE